MASSYSTNLAIELIGTGDQAGTWGVTTNTNLGTLIEQAISGYVTQAVATGTDTTITIPNGATGVARNMYIELTGTGGASTNLIVPANKKLYFIFNNTASGQVTVKVSGQTGVSVPNGAKMILVSNGTDIVDATNYVGNISAASGNITVLTSASATITNLIATTASVSDLSATVSRSASATITNLLATSLTVSSGSTLNGGVVVNETGADVDFRIESDTYDHAFFLNGANGNVGIGTDSPATRLDVNSANYNPLILRRDGGTDANTCIQFQQATTYWQAGAGTDGNFGIVYNNTNLGTSSQFRITSAGNVGIGTSSPDTQLVLSANNNLITPGTAPLNTLRFNDTDTGTATAQPTGRIEFYVNDATAGGTGIGSLIEGRTNGNDGGGSLIFQGSATGSTGTLKTLLSLSGLSGAVFNNDGEDLDFRIESDTVESAFFLDGATGNVGIGTGSPNDTLHVYDATANVVANFESGDAGAYLSFKDDTTTDYDQIYMGAVGNDFVVANGTPRFYINSSGNVGIGTSSPNTLVEMSGANGTSILRMNNPDTGLSTNEVVGQIEFYQNDISVPANIGVSAIIAAQAENTSGSTGLRFYTGTGASCPERARITSGGDLLVAKTVADASSIGTVGHELRSNGQAFHTADATSVVSVNRLTSDGTLVAFYQATNLEGTISVSGATVSYNAFAGSHWSQLQDGSKPDILRGTVLESINELCEWPDETNERLPKCKISDTAGSKKVYGVFMAWDNDWTETNDMYVTAVGAFICRVNAGVTVQEGDLLESNGDGTARVQADDLIRSSTIGKVTSTVKTHEYDDGSYCVPTVLYCG